MPTYEITGKNGGTYRIDANDDAQAQRLEQFINTRIDAGDPGLKGAPLPENAQLAPWKGPVPQTQASQAGDTGNLSGMTDQEVIDYIEKLPSSMRPGLVDMGIHGATAGIETELSSLLGAGANAITHPIEAFQTGGQSVADAYHDWRRRSLALMDYVRIKHPSLAPISEIAGAVATPGGAVKGLKWLAAAGGAYGLVHGFENSNGPLGERAIEAGKEGVMGAVAAPAVGALLKVPGAITSATKSVLGSNPDLARRIVTKAIAADENTAASVGHDIMAAQANDVPMMLADTGENARGTLAAATRSSGPARTIARDALEERQAGLAERVTGAIERDLGPVANPHRVADQLMTKARDEAAPLYESAYAKPGADTFVQKMAATFQRPSMKKAFQSAYRIAQEEGRDPTTLGFDINDAGEVSLTRVPSWQTLDYVKRGLDDVVEAYRDPTSGKLNLNTEGRAINNTLRFFLGAFDKANPDYAAARAAYAGPVSGINAMNKGLEALNMTADDLEARMRDMTPFEKQMFALGARRAMAELVSSKGDTANVVNALIGTGKKRAMLARLFGDKQQFGRFVETMGQEREGFRTYARALQGSSTAVNVQDDATLSIASSAANLVASGGMSVGDAIKTAMRFGVGRAGENARQQVAALLSNTDPARFQELAAQLRAEAIRRGVWNKRIDAIAAGGGKAALIGVNDGRQGNGAALQPQ